MRKPRFWNNLIIACCIVLNIIFLGMMIGQGKNDRILVTLFFFFVLFVPRLVRKITKIMIPDRLEFVYLLFIFLAHFLGSVVGLYSTVYWYDMFNHFLSGILSAFLGLYVLWLFRQYHKNTFWFSIFFMFCFTLMVAGCWEIFEFFSDTLLGGNTQHSLDTGVKDTMEDMIMATMGGLLTISWYGYEYSGNKKGLFYYFIKELEGGKSGKGK